MGIFKMPRSEWIKIDCNYLERIERRKALLDSHHEFCIGYNEPTRLAVRELYEEVMIKQIPRRFPTIFSIRQNDFTNHVTGCRSSIKIADLKEEYMLEALAENVEEDFYFMCPHADCEYRQAYSSCFPQGLLSSASMGQSILPRRIYDANIP